jgi:hypothetical protein
MTLPEKPRNPRKTSVKSMLRNGLNPVNIPGVAMLENKDHPCYTVEKSDVRRSEDDEDPVCLPRQDTIQVFKRP